MLCYDKIKDNPTVLLSFTSLSKEEFEAVLVAFDEAWHQVNPIESPERQRASGGGRKPTLSCRADQLLFILFYLKTYPLQEVLGFFFGMSQTQANHWIYRLADILQRALGALNYLPERETERLAEVLGEYEVLEFAQDGTERRRQRPTDDEKQRRYYSGKKKAHTLKNHLIVHPESRQVCYLSDTVPGKTHDKKLADESNLTFPAQSLLEQDTGYQGYAPDNVLLLQPKKKPRKQELTVSEKFVNRVISSGRIVVENVIAGVKRCRIVKDILRNRHEGFDDLIMDIACGLHNLRVAFRSPTQTISLVDFYFQ